MRKQNVNKVEICIPSIMRSKTLQDPLVSSYPMCQKHRFQVCISQISKVVHQT
jgi:hypothetical protein